MRQGNGYFEFFSVVMLCGKYGNSFFPPTVANVDNEIVSYLVQV